MFFPEMFQNQSVAAIACNLAGQFQLTTVQLIACFMAVLCAFLCDSGLI
jgi:hypothetical protein